MIFGGVEENIPRPFGPRKRRARSRREYRNAESHERFEFDARPRPRCGANTGAGTIVSTPGTLRRLGARCQISWKWDKWRKNRNTRRGSRAKGREAREPGTRVSIGLTNRTRGPRTGSIRSDVERARSAIARDGRARISTSRAAPVSPVFRGKTEENAEEGWPANGRKPSRELTCVACRLVDVREGTRVSNEGRLEACRLARCRQPRARGAQRSGGGDVKSKTKIPRELDRVASGVQSTVVFLCLQKPKTEIHRTVLSQSIIIRPIT